MRRSVTLFLLSLLFVFPTGSAFATTVEDATVNLYCRIKASGRTYSTTGSGVFVHESGIILTNAHVAQYFLFSTSTKSTKAECKVRTGSPAKDKYTASLLYLSPAWAQATVDETTKKQPRKGTGESDFALLKVIGATKGKLPAKFPAISIVQIPALAEGQKVTIAGYPAEDLSFKEMQRKLKYATASSSITAIQAFARPNQDLLTLAATPLSASGVSGGPVARDSGVLIGIAVTLAEKTSKDRRSLRAITLSYIDRALKSETGFPLQIVVSVPSLVKFNPLLPPFSDLRQTIEKTLRNTRE